MPLGEVPVEGLGPVWGQNLTLGRTIFFQSLNNLNEIYENIKKHHPVRLYDIQTV